MEFFPPLLYIIVFVLSKGVTTCTKSVLYGEFFKESENGKPVQVELVLVWENSR